MRNILVLLLLSSCVFAGCLLAGERVSGNGKVASETRPIRDVSKIRISGSMDVILEAGSPNLRVEAEENILPYIVTDFEDNWLRIGYKSNINISTHQPVKVFLSVPTIENLKVSGSGNVSSESKFSSGKRLTLEVSGSGNVVLHVNTPVLDARISGSGNIDVTGETRDVILKVSGSGNYKGAGLRAENVTASVSGSGDAQVFADVLLKARTSGSGDIRYRGNARVDKQVSGSGSVEKMQ